MSNEFFGKDQVGLVDSFTDLVNTDFYGTKNAFCWYRNLNGDFEEIVSKLHSPENITEVSAEDLMALKLSEPGTIARKIILKDLKELSAFGASPVLNLLKSYDRDEELDFFSTDVYSFHVDRSPVATDTFLCTYYGAASDIIQNNQVEQKVLIPEIREKLKKLHDGAEGDFEEFLKECFFDLHYQPKPGSMPLNLSTGHLWRLAVDHPEQKVLPCVHRAPLERDGEPRLLLIC
ncbi:DUF1826 domain-containing protein [Pedobacter sp. BMA]|uniref:DUF1826 domain-containing protein n=1 Tax=Pedobacter sp. BMA TaxID=1663685 RepID=UPI0018CCC22A